MDGASIENLYRVYGSVVYRRALMILRDEQAARDAVQEVFVRAMRSGVEFWEDVSPVTWLYRVTTNYCLNVQRDRLRRERLLPKEESPPLQRSDVDDRLTAMELLVQLPQELSQIAVYYYFDQMNHSEIAELLGVSRRTVGNRLDEFRTKARRLVECT